VSALDAATVTSADASYDNGNGVTVDRTASDPMIGRVLDGRYRIDSKIAPGGMATVYRATDLRLDRVVAVKVMRHDLGEDHDFARKFVREARAAAALSHPHIVAIFDQGDDNGTLFIAMEYIAGKTMRDLIREHAPLDPVRALRLLEPVVSALATAHRAGIIHRDIKPENVLLADDGRIKVADFGLARVIEADGPQATATQGVIIGSVSYLAPEVVEHNSSSPRADVYAVGVILYELLTGQKPHQGESPIQIAYKHVHEDVPAPSLIQPGIPDYVDALITGATSREGDRRPTDAGVLLRHIGRVLDAASKGIESDPELADDLSPSLPAWLTGSYDDDPHGDQEGTTVIARETPRIPPSRPSAPQPPTEERAYPRYQKRGRILLLFVLAFALVAGVTGWYLGVARYTHAPSVIGLTVAQAKATLADAGLSLEVAGQEYSETVEAGHIISSDPEPDGRIRDGATVEVVVSKGPERYPVPDLRGLTLGEATAALKRRRMTVGDVKERYNERIAEGLVIKSDPEVDAIQAPGAVIDLTVSLGPKPIDVPDYTGEDLATAKSALDELGFDVVVTRAFDDEVATGVVILQSPNSGTQFRGDTIELVVSRGPEFREVPDVVQMGVQDARATLRAAGFKVKVEKTGYYVGLQYVVQQDPGSGDLARAGSTITIYIV
jgi:serine/threonine-protein kinase